MRNWTAVAKRSSQEVRIVGMKLEVKAKEVLVLPRSMLVVPNPFCK